MNNNLAFYVPSLTETEVSKKIFQCLNKGLEAGSLNDASLFFDDVDKNTQESKFGMFNSTELWNFVGYLVVCGYNCYNTASKVVNKFKLGFLYCGEEFKLPIMKISQKCKVFCLNEEDAKKFYRLTNTQAIVLNLENDALKVIGALNDQ